MHEIVAVFILNILFVTPHFVPFHTIYIIYHVPFSSHTRFIHHTYIYLADFFVFGILESVVFSSRLLSFSRPVWCVNMCPSLSNVGCASWSRCFLFRRIASDTSFFISEFGMAERKMNGVSVLCLSCLPRIPFTTVRSEDWRRARLVRALVRVARKLGATVGLGALTIIGIYLPSRGIYMPFHFPERLIWGLYGVNLMFMSGWMCSGWRGSRSFGDTYQPLWWGQQVYSR